MSELCDICGPVKHEAPTVLCAPCALRPSMVEDFFESGSLDHIAKRCAAIVAQIRIDFGSTVAMGFVKP